MANIKQIQVGNSTYDVYDAGASRSGHTHSYLPLAGGTLTGDLIINAPHRDNYYASNLCRHFYGGTPTEFVIKTKIKYLSGTHMPVVRIYGYAYGAQCPIELRIGFYIYGGNLGWAGVVSTGAWKPDVYLFKYTENSVEYVAVGLKGSCYFCGFQVDCQIGASGSFGSAISIDGWTTTHNGADTTQTLIPAVGTDNCIQVDYKTMKTDISGSATYATSAGSATKATQDGSGNVITSTYLKLSGGNLTGHVTTNDGVHIRTGGTSGSGSLANYLSAGAGYSKSSGLYGVKVVCCDQSDCQSGLGQDLNPSISGGYDMCVVTGASSANYSSLSFVSHLVNNNTYTALGEFINNNGTVSLNVRGKIKSNGTEMQTKATVSGNTICF